MALAPFKNPISVIQRSPMCGVFGTSTFTDDKEGFVERVLGHWYCIQGNTLPCESARHTACAEELFAFYVAFRARVECGFTAKGRVLLHLYQTGNVRDSLLLLDKLK